MEAYHERSIWAYPSRAEITWNFVNDDYCSFGELYFHKRLKLISKPPFKPSGYEYAQLR